MKAVTVIILFLFLSSCFLIAQEGYTASPDQTVQRLYNLVTFEAGFTPDWDEVRSLFIDEAVVVLRTSRDSSTVFDLEGFVDDFINFIEHPQVKSSGFSETILNMKTLEFRDMASVLVLYEAHITDSERPPQKGVDNFSLIKKNDQWKIVSVTNDLPNPENPVPGVLMEQTAR